MSRNQRIALVVGAVAVAVLAFAIARPGDDDEGSEPSADTAPAQTETGTETEAKPAPPPEPKVTRIRLEGGAAVGGVKTIRAEQGETVRIVVAVDAPDEIHLHGYDVEREAAPGQPARFRFDADAEGEFELESHVAEDAGNEPLIARLRVGPT